MNHYGFEVSETAFELFLKLHPHVLVLWHSYKISVTSEFSLFGIGLKTKTRKLQKIFFLSIEFN